MSVQICPDESTLGQLLLGKLSGEQQKTVEAHLENCAECARRAETLQADDEFVNELRRLSATAREVEQTIGADSGRIQEVLDTVQHSMANQETVWGHETQVEANPSHRVSAKRVHTSAELDLLSPAWSGDELGWLGQYKVMEVLGSGGMGVVYRAEDTSLKRTVALKAMKPAIAANPEAKHRFLKEAEATAAIEHDNIVTIYQVGEDHGIPFFAMQFLKGESLGTRSERVSRMSQAEVIRIGREIAEGLSAAHSRGLIHRDIKPDNIWLQEGTDRVRIVDFGLVRSSEEDAGLTQSGTVLGTPKYMAPEQARGETVDHRCDLFSLGCVLYRLLAGKAPFEGSNLTATLIAVTQRDAEPVENLVSNVEPSLAALIAKLLSKDRESRHASAKEVADQLRSIENKLQDKQKVLSSQSVESTERTYDVDQNENAIHPLPVHSNGDKSPPRSRLLVGSLGGFIAIILLSLLVLKLRTKDGLVIVELETELPVAKVEIDGSTVQFAQEVNGKSLTLSIPEGKHSLTLTTAEGVVLTTDLGSKPVQVAVNETTKIRAWLDQSEPSGNQLNEPAVVSVGPVETIAKSPSLIQNSSTKLWPPGPLPIWARELWDAASLKTPAHGMVGVVERPSQLEGMARWNVDTVYARSPINVARFSPDGKWLATGSGDGHTRVYDAATMKLHQLLPGVCGQHGTVDLAWHPDSQRLAVVAETMKVLRLWSIDGKLLREEFVEGGRYSTFTAVAWTMNGDRLICGGGNRLEVRDADGNLLKALVTGEEGPHCDFGNIAVSGKDQRFVCWQNDAVRIWNAETFELEHEVPIPYQGKSYGGHRIKWSQGDRIALSTNDRLIICSADGKILNEFPNEPLCAFAWKPDGETLTVWRWDTYNLNTDSGETSPAPESRMIVAGGAGTVPTAMDWSPGGKQMVAASGRLVICKAGLNEIDFDCNSRMFQINSLSLNPDGSRISAVAAFGDDSVRIWSENGVAHETMPLGEMVFPGAKVAWSPDGGWIATGSPQGTLQVGSLNNGFTKVDGYAMSLAWAPDGTLLAAGLTDGRVLIINREGKTLQTIDTGESGGVNVAWSRHGQLIALAGNKLLRINVGSDESPFTILASNASGWVPSESATWNPNGNDVHFSSLKVSITGDAQASVAPFEHFVTAWSPDGTRFLSATQFAKIFRSDGTYVVARAGIGSTTGNAGAWSPSGTTIFLGNDQSLLIARNAEDLQVKWSAVMLPNQQSVTFDVGGSVIDGTRETLDNQFVYYAADEEGNVTVFSPHAFELQTGEELLPVPGRFFDSKYKVSIDLGDAWKPAPSESVTVPGDLRSAYVRPGGVSLNLFVQETGAAVDPSWMLAESVKAQEEKLAATVVEKDVRQVAGHEAMWMIVEGMGSGSAIDGKGPVKTTQHWVAIPRETHVLVALLTSPSGTYKSNRELFEQSLESLRMAD